MKKEAKERILNKFKEIMKIPNVVDEILKKEDYIKEISVSAGEATEEGPKKRFRNHIEKQKKELIEMKIKLADLILEKFKDSSGGWANSPAFQAGLSKSTSLV